MDSDLLKSITDTITAQAKKMGTFNLLVAGKSGVGKSTLINAVFEGDFAETGVGLAVSKGSREITKEGELLRLIDTEGLQLDDYRQILSELMAYVKARNSSSDASERIHAAWICIAEGVPRGEKAEAELAEALNHEGISVVIVITQSFRREGVQLRSELQRIIPHAANVVRVVATDIEEEIGPNEVHIIRSRGLDTLIEVTNQIIPKATENAFIAALKGQLDLKERAAKSFVKAFAITAAGVAMVPIPVFNLVATVPAVVGMLWNISRIYGYEADRSFLLWLITSSLATVSVDGAIKLVFGLVIQFIPGINYMVNATVTGAAIGISVTALGDAYVQVMRKLYIAGQLEETNQPKEQERVIQQEVANALQSGREEIITLGLRSGVPLSGSAF